MKRKSAYYLLTGLMFVPYTVAYAATLAFEWMDGKIRRLRRWAFPDKFARIPRDAEDGHLLPPAMQESLSQALFSRQEMDDFLRRNT